MSSIWGFELFSCPFSFHLGWPIVYLSFSFLSHYVRMLGHEILHSNQVDSSPLSHTQTTCLYSATTNKPRIVIENVKLIKKEVMFLVYSAQTLKHAFCSCLNKKQKYCHSAVTPAIPRRFPFVLLVFYCKHCSRNMQAFCLCRCNSTTF